MKRVSWLLAIVSLLIIVVPSYAKHVCPPLKKKKITSYELYLGMPVAELQRKGFVKGRYVPTEKDDPSVIYSKEPAGKYEKILCWTYKGKVYKIELFFRDKSRTNYNIIKKILNDKYGRGYSSIMSNLVMYVTHIGKYEVDIVLDLAEVLDKYLKVVYAYDCLYKQVKKEIEKAKASRIKNEL